MAKSQPVHRYAAGALLALALHQAQIHQCFLPSDTGLSFCVDQGGPSAVASEGEDKNLWTNYHCGLLRSVFRYLKIDPKAWSGLEQTAISSDAKYHIGAFLRILSEEEEENALTPSLQKSSEANLAEAVEAVTLRLKETTTSDASLLKNNARKSSNTCENTSECSHSNTKEKRLLQDAKCLSVYFESQVQEASECHVPLALQSTKDSLKAKDFGKSTEDASPLYQQDNKCREEEGGASGLLGPIEVYSADFDSRWDIDNFAMASTSLQASQEAPLVKENYFGSALRENGSTSSEPISKLQVPAIFEKQEFRESKEAAIDETRVGGTTDNCSMNDNKILEGKLLTQQRKVAVLYELLAACVADTPVEEGGKSKLRRGYDARHRVALRLLATWLDVKWENMAAMEVMVAYSAMAAQEERDANPDEDEKRHRSWARWKRGGLIGAAALTGGALLALTGGLAAPAIAAGLSALAPTLGTIIPVIGSSGFAAAAAAAGTTAGSVAVAASFGAAGASLTGSKMYRRTGGVDEFGFEGLGENHQQGRLAVGIFVSGFINNPDDFTKPWKGQDFDLERYALRWETKNLIVLSTAIQDWMTASITKELMKQGAMLTVLSTLVAAFAWPSALLTLTDFIDSKWALAVDRSDKAGKLLAQVLLKGLQGNRPVTLIGFSLGARVIFKCLEKLAKKQENGGIVERVVLFGAPLSVDSHRWETVRKESLATCILVSQGLIFITLFVKDDLFYSGEASGTKPEKSLESLCRLVVAGRFVNAYSTNDWLLGVVYRASLLTQGLAGIQAVNVPGIENVDVTDVIKGHSSYLSKVPVILQAIDIDSYYPIFPSKISIVDSSN